MPEAYTPVSLGHTPPVCLEHTYKQTSSLKQTSEEISFDPAFEEFRFLVDTKTFERFMNGTKLISIEDNTTVIGTPFAYAKDFIENRLGDKIRRALKVDHMRCVVLTG